MEPNVSNLLADLAQMTKRTSNFGQLRQLLPLVEQLKKTDANNKEISSILGVINSALTQIRGTQGIANRVGSSYSNMVDRMKSQLNREVNNLQQFLKEVETKQRKVLKNVEDDKYGGEYECIRQIESIIESNVKKLEQSIEKQRQLLCLQSSTIEIDSLKIKLVKQSLKNNKVNEDISKCEVMLGQIRCYSDALNRGNQQCEEDDFKHKVDSFIAQCQQHFDREVTFVCSKLKAFSQNQGSSAFEVNLYKRFYDWALRLKISLQSAIIRLSFYRKESFLHLKNKNVLERWEQAMVRWQHMHGQLQEILH